MDDYSIYIVHLATDGDNFPNLDIFTADGLSRKSYNTDHDSPNADHR